MAEIVGFDDTLGSLSVKDVWAAVLLLAFTFGHVPPCVVNVVAARREKNRPIWPVFLEWTPMVVFTGSLVAWLGSPYSTLLSENHLCLLCLTLSFVFGRMTTKMILAHLTRQPFPYWTGLLAPLIGGAVMVNLPYFGFEPVSSEIQLYYLWAYFIVSMVVYFRWAYLVCNAICNYLGINCLTIPEEKWKVLKQQQENEKKKA